MEIWRSPTVGERTADVSSILTVAIRVRGARSNTSARQAEDPSANLGGRIAPIGQPAVSLASNETMRVQAPLGASGPMSQLDKLVAREATNSGSNPDRPARLRARVVHGRACKA